MKMVKGKRKIKNFECSLALGFARVMPLNVDFS